MNQKRGCVHEKLSLLLPLMPISAFLFCSPGAAEDDPAGLRKKIGGLNRIMEEATIAGDYETVLKYYHEDAVISSNFAPTLFGRQALREHYDKDRKRGVHIHSLSGAIEEIWQRGSEIYERGTFGLSASSKGNGLPAATYGSCFQIWDVDDDGQLKIKYVRALV